MPVQTSITRLLEICDQLPARFRMIPENDWLQAPAPGKWSKQEILGHLIDSAANNHQRFVRMQFENSPTIVYDQNNWNRCSRYREMQTGQLIAFWELYNRHLASLVQLIPPTDLAKPGYNGGAEALTLAAIFEDYVQHLEYHLRQIVPSF